MDSRNRYAITKLIVLTNLHNPGTLIDEDTLRRIGELA
jgi:hypothetical protein